MRPNKDKPVATTVKRVRRKPAPAARTPSAEVLRLQAATASFSARRDRDRLPHRIASKRLVLRAPIRGDVPALVVLADNKRIADVLARLPHPYTRADAIGFVEIFAQRPDERPYAITLADQLIGIVGLTFRKDGPPEIGYWLGEPHWGNGYMREAVAALIEAVRVTGVFPVLAARALADNAGSLRVLEGAGFHRTGETVDDKGRTMITLLKELRG